MFYDVNQNLSALDSATKQLNRSHITYQQAQNIYDKKFYNYRLLKETIKVCFFSQISKAFSSKGIIFLYNFYVCSPKEVQERSRRSSTPGFLEAPC